MREREADEGRRGRGQLGGDGDVAAGEERRVGAEGGGRGESREAAGVGGARLPGELETGRFPELRLDGVGVRECGEAPDEPGGVGSGAAGRVDVVAEGDVRVDARLLLEERDEARQERGEAVGKVLGVPVDAEAFRVAAREPGGRGPREGHRDGDAGEAGDGGVVEVREADGGFREAGDVLARAGERLVREGEDARRVRVGAEEEERVVEAGQRRGVARLERGDGPERGLGLAGPGAPAPDGFEGFEDVVAHAHLRGAGCAPALADSSPAGESPPDAARSRRAGA